MNPSTLEPAGARLITRALTAAEFEAIKAHPSAGARILRSIPFLAPHIPTSSCITNGPSVDALIAALPRLVAQSEPLDPNAFQWAQRARSA